VEVSKVEEEKSHVRFIMFILLVIFLVGLFAGYYFWGYRKMSQPDYKDMLKQTISYISDLEEKNKGLSAQITALGNEVDSLKKQQAAPEDNQMVRLNERLSVLEKENADLKSSVSRNEALVQENQQLRQRVQALVEQMNSSRPPKPVGSAPLSSESRPGAVP
jgi:cell division protein FtsB